jgi:hypothetical protein
MARAWVVQEWLELVLRLVEVEAFLAWVHVSEGR